MATGQLNVVVADVPGASDPMVAVELVPSIEAVTVMFASVAAPLVNCTVVVSCRVSPGSYDALSRAMEAVTTVGIDVTVNVPVARVTGVPLMLETSVAV